MFSYLENSDKKPQQHFGQETRTEIVSVSYLVEVLLKETQEANIWSSSVCSVLKLFAMLAIFEPGLPGMLISLATLTSVITELVHQTRFQMKSSKQNSMVTCA